jgi:hypothetical protein
MEPAKFRKTDAAVSFIHPIDPADAQRSEFVRARGSIQKTVFIKRLPLDELLSFSTHQSSTSYARLDIACKKFALSC